ncbi:hypothetical protein FRC05_006438 [Tulasnella sp. 425]|nr:hypothetical protein FRC05_006438 [Tulasnella sp. 425]
MLAAVKHEQNFDVEAVVANGYGDLGFDAMNMSFNSTASGYSTMEMVEYALGLRTVTLIVSPVRYVKLGDD